MNGFSFIIKLLLNTMKALRTASVSSSREYLTTFSINVPVCNLYLYKVDQTVKV